MQAPPLPCPSKKLNSQPVLTTFRTTSVSKVCLSAEPHAAPPGLGGLFRSDCYKHVAPLALGSGWGSALRRSLPVSPGLPPSLRQLWRTGRRTGCRAGRVFKAAGRLIPRWELGRAGKIVGTSTRLPFQETQFTTCFNNLPDNLGQQGLPFRGTPCRPAGAWRFVSERLL